MNQDEQNNQEQGNFGDRVKEIRLKANLDKAAFAAKIGLQNAAAVDYLESLQTPDNLLIILALAKIFKVDLNWLLLGEETPVVEGELDALRSIKSEFRTVLNALKSNSDDLKGIGSRIKKIIFSLDKAVKEQTEHAL